MIKKLILTKSIIFTLSITLPSAELFGQEIQPNKTETKELIEQKSRLIRAKEKVENIIDWCEENPRKTILIAVGVVATFVLGTKFLIGSKSDKEDSNLLSANKSLKLKFDKKLIDAPNPKDGKLPNGDKDPIQKVVKFKNCTVSITQVPGLVQIRNDCGYYTLFGLKCFAEGNEKDLTNRELYQKCEVEWKNELSNEKYKNNKLRNNDLSWIEDEAMDDLINQTDSLSKVKEHLDETDSFSNEKDPFLLIHNTLIDIPALRNHLKNRKIKLNSPLLFGINDAGRNHWFASKVVFKDKNNIDLTIYDSYGNATGTDCVKHIARSLAKAASKLK